MHYQDGTEVKIGDLARTVAKPEQAATYPQNETLFVVVNGMPSASSCNIYAHALASRSIGPLGTGPWMPYAQSCLQSFNSSDALKVV